MRINVVFTLVMAAAPMPCTARHAISEANVVERAHPAEATVKSTRPDMYMRR